MFFDPAPAGLLNTSLPLQNPELDTAALYSFETRTVNQTATTQLVVSSPQASLSIGRLLNTTQPTLETTAPAVLVIRARQVDAVAEQIETGPVAAQVVRGRLVSCQPGLLEVTGDSHPR